MISAIVPTFNRAATLERALASIEGQTRPPDELIVVDDGSTDDTAELVRRRFPSAIYVHQENRGVSAARNRGIREARGDWLAFLDSDDEWLPEKLERQLATLDCDGGVACHTDELWVRDGRRVNPGQRHAKYGGRIFRACLPLCAISPSSVVIHRRVFERVGLFDEELPACEDYDMWLRLTASYPVSFVDQPLLVKHGGHDDQLSRTVPGLDRYRIRALQKILASGALPEADRRAARATLSAKARIFAAGAEKRGRTEEAERFRALIERPMLTVVTALMAEARPIVDRLDLQQVEWRPFRVFRAGDVELVVSGIGRDAARRAVEHLAGRGGRQPRAWLNVGIAGHRVADLGSIWIAHRVVDSESGRSWYPPAVFEVPFAGATVRTVPEVVSDAADDALYEMEAAGFCEEASRHALAELVQVVKVVSDNAERPPESLTKQDVEDSIRRRLPEIEGVCSEMVELAQKVAEREAAPPELDGYLGRWRFTVTQQRQLDRLLRRLAALDRSVPADELTHVRSRRGVLQELGRRL